MITTPEQYASRLAEIQAQGYSNKARMINVETEPRFIIDADTRTITVPKALSMVGVYRDHDAETVWFEVDRYFDEEDLSTKTIVVQYINAKGEMQVYPVTDRNIEFDSSKLLFAWKLSSNVFEEEGQVQFSVRFYKMEENDSLSYNLGTKPATVTVGKGLYITDHSETKPSGSDLEQALQKIESILANGEAHTGADYTGLRNLPTINGVVVQGNLTSEDLKIEAVLPEGVLKIGDVEDKLSDTSIYPVQNKVIAIKVNSQQDTLTTLYDKITKIEEEMGNMSYVPLTIESFTVNGVENFAAERGSSVANPVFKWKLSKTPTYLKIGSVAMTDLVAEGSYTSKTTVNSSDLTSAGYVKSYAVTAQDAKSTATTTLKITFVEGTYYGASAAETTTLASRVITLENTIEINVNAGTNEYIYISCPKGKTPTFSVGGFVGGFDKVKEFDFTNGYNYKSTYTLYRSTQHSLGQTKVKITYS